MCIRDRDGLIEIITCDEKGKAQFTTDIPIGSYYVKEISTDVYKRQGVGSGEIPIEPGDSWFSPK